jgi:hypothetical protein
MYLKYNLNKLAHVYPMARQPFKKTIRIQLEYSMTKVARYRRTAADLRSCEITIVKQFKNK